MLGRRKEYHAKKWHIVFFVALAIVAILLRFVHGRMDTAQVSLAGESFTVLLPQTMAEFYTGLGGRDALAPYGGMLFIYDTPTRPTMVMRDMRFPLDFVWFLDGEVVDMAPEVATEPGVPEAGLTRYAPRTAANAVLELPAGWIGEHGLKIGDRLTVLPE